MELKTFPIVYFQMRRNNAFKATQRRSYTASVPPACSKRAGVEEARASIKELETCQLER